MSVNIVQCSVHGCLGEVQILRSQNENFSLGPGRAFQLWQLNWWLPGFLSLSQSCSTLEMSSDSPKTPTLFSKAWNVFCNTPKKKTGVSNTFNTPRELHSGRLVPQGMPDDAGKGHGYRFKGRHPREAEARPRASNTARPSAAATRWQHASAGKSLHPTHVIITGLMFLGPDVLSYSRVYRRL